MTFYRAIANATAREAPDRKGKSFGTVLAGALVEGLRIVSGETVAGVNQWVNTDQGWFIHMGAMEAVASGRPGGDAMAYIEALLAQAEFEVIRLTMIRDALRGAPA